ncbi:hypothetical protein [Cohnella phaseoli]|uniref:Uncharacterized protein n=1 Tax=Cohnella phaseoli TaxID=456490 RepID=A0A3D9KSM9_9BACL|nr:hypothetical protein [Cohnella phaseoli]RED89169.1 hypothetical protein DFP98_101140 [Cohnella phaseoli]
MANYFKPKPILFISVSTIIALSIYYFFEKNDQTYIETFDNYSYVAEGNGVQYGLVTSNKQKTIEERTFYLKKGQSIDLNIVVANGLKETTEFLLLPFLDYSQHSIDISNKFQSSFSFSLKSRELRFFQVKIGEELEEGLHDFIVFFIKNPNDTETSTKYRDATEFNHLVGVRVTLIVEEEKQKNVIPRIHSTELIDNNILDGMLLTKGSSLNKWSVEEVDKGQVTNFFINVGNKNKKELPFALIILQDWTQLSIRDDKKAIFGVLPQQKLISVKSETVPFTKDVSNLTAILVPYPFEKVSRFSPMDVEASVRIALIRK